MENQENLLNSKQVGSLTTFGTVQLAKYGWHDHTRG